MIRRLTGLVVLVVFALLADCRPQPVSSPTTHLAVSGHAPYAALSLTRRDVTNGVMLEAFYWDVPQTTPAGSWWKNLESKAPEFQAAGFTAVWLPPPYKGWVATNDVGYGVYDRYDLGEFNQKGAIATRYGTRDELISAVKALHANRLDVYADIVMNHMMGADEQDHFDYNGQHFDTWTHFTFPGRGNTYSSYTWQYWNFNGWQQDANTWLQWNPWDFQPYLNGQAYDNLMGCEIRYADVNNQNELIVWGKWLTQTLNLDGYRLDATKHILTPFVNRWFDEVAAGRFSVSEAWFGSVDDLQQYAQMTGGRTHLFDFPLHNVFVSTISSGGDFRALKFAGFTERNGLLSVPFVDNHDTDRSSPVVNAKMLAYAYLLTRDKGYPCVFYKDYYEYHLGDQIRQLIALRQEHAWGASREYDETDHDVYVYSRTGDATHQGLLLVLNQGGDAERDLNTPFVSANLADLSGHATATVSTDASGKGHFPLVHATYEVWVPRAP